ncbi:MAG: helix-turn-helix transcriptional regulator [Lachnospiraceae bacterium]|nr:helix-turn-helix transcriptional regulator [Lachnospiraceae bacterium]
MDTVKVGAFLRELRKEKNLTQEQLAEVFQVTNRTVSRWETGSNMPDVSLLLEIADYYQLDVREILNGERKPPEEKKTDADADQKAQLQEMAQYVDSDKEKMALRTRIYAIIGLIAIIINVCLNNFGPADSTPATIIKKICILLVYLALSASILYTTERLQVLQRKYKEKLKKNFLPILLIIIGAVALLLTVIPFFMIGVA